MKIYLDENLSKYIAEALNLLNKVQFPSIEVFSTIEVFGRGVPDEILIPKIGNEGSMLITKDLNIKKRHLQYELCKQYNLGIFFIDLPKNQNKHWDIVKLLIYNWEEIVQKTGREEPPFAYRIKPKGKMEKL
jgi:PIN like domain